MKGDSGEGPPVASPASGPWNFVLSLPRTSGSLGLNKDMVLCNQGGSCCGFVEGPDAGSRVLWTSQPPTPLQSFFPEKQDWSCLCDLKMGLSWGLTGRHHRLWGSFLAFPP